MANEPQQVDLLRGDHSVIFSVRESHPESLNSRGSENTRIARIIGPAGSVVSFFDDQQFRTGQNSLQITKTVSEPIEVPIAQNFLSGEQNSGMYMNSRPGFNWVFTKQMEQHPWLDIIKNGIEWVINSIFNHSDDTEHATVPGTQGEVVDGFVPKGLGGRTDNNHVDNLSSIQFGGEPMTAPSIVVARILAH